MKVSRLLPYEDTNLTRYLMRRFDIIADTKTQRQIGSELGYHKPNIISMIKRGESRLPLDRLVRLAASLEVDPVHLFRLAVEAYWPDLDVVLTAIIEQKPVSKNEYDILLMIREETQNTDPTLTSDLRKRVKVAFGKP